MVRTTVAAVLACTGTVAAFSAPSGSFGRRVLGSRIGRGVTGREASRMMAEPTINMIVSSLNKSGVPVLAANETKWYDAEEYHRAWPPIELAAVASLAEKKPPVFDRRQKSTWPSRAAAAAAAAALWLGCCRLRGDSQLVAAPSAGRARAHDATGTMGVRLWMPAPPRRPSAHTPGSGAAFLGGCL